MIRQFLLPLAGLALLAGAASSASALPRSPVSLSPASEIVPVANGCGPGGYRGPMGACHPYGRGPFPGGYYGPYGHSFAMDHGCGAGRYRGPYGSCHKFGTGPYPQGYSGPYYN
jgi:hypothetical protein